MHEYHRYHKYAAVGLWPTAVLLFALGAVEPEGQKHYNLYAFGVLLALAAATFTIVAALEATVTRIAVRELAKSREMLAEAVGEALAEEMERRAELGTLRRVH